MSFFFNRIKVVFIFFFLFALSSIDNGFSQERQIGEIINVNHQYKIAFTDLSHEHLSIGEIVEVLKDDKFLTYLEVLQTSEVVSKLGFVERGELATEEASFNSIIVGSTVAKLREETAIQDLDVALNKIGQLKTMNMRLQKEVADKSLETLTIEEEVKRYQKNIETLESKVSILKNQLKNISKLIDQHIAIYETK